MPGASLGAVRAALRSRNLDFSEVPIEHCAGFYMDPRFPCAGGPALWVTINDSVSPWNPFYSPSLNAFLAFDSSLNLETSVVALQGGDR